MGSGSSKRELSPSEASQSPPLHTRPLSMTNPSLDTTPTHTEIFNYTIYTHIYVYNSLKRFILTA